MKTYRLNQELKVIKEGWNGNLKIGKEYANGQVKDEMIVPIDLMKWKFSRNPQRVEKKKDTFKLKVIKNKAFLDANEDMIVWLGHASFFIRIDGVTMITDPVFYNVSFIKRMAGLSCEVEDLVGIDYILLSHGHRDHFDKKSLKVLFKQNPEVEALIPLELNAFFEKNNIKNQQAAWYQEYKIKHDFDIVFMPAKHWNRRGPFDFNRNLWGSFVIRFNNKTIYFSGDTAYGDHFTEVNELFGDIDYCLLSVGAYKPYNIMHDSHMDPLEAIESYKDLKGKMFIPMHFGTYDLSDEPIGEPVRILNKNSKGNNIKILDIGEVLLI